MHLLKHLSVALKKPGQEGPGTICANAKGVIFCGSILLGDGLEMSESQVCDLEITVIWRGSVLIKDQNIGWFDVLMDPDGTVLRAIHLQIQI